mgnify:FL=1
MQIKYSTFHSIFECQSSDDLKKNLTDFFGRHKFMPTLEVDYSYVLVKFDVIALNTAQQIYNAACRLAKERQLDAAYIYYKDALLAFPNLICAMQCKAQIEILREQYDVALDTLIGALNLNPKDANLLALLGFVFKKIEQPDSGDKFFKEALSLEKENPFANLWLRGFDFTMAIFEEITPLYEGLIVPYQDMVQSPFLFAKALADYNEDDDMLHAYDVAVSASIWESIYSEERELGIKVLEDVLSCLDKRLAEWQWLKIQHVVDAVEKETGVRVALIEQKNSGYPASIIDINEAMITYNPSKPYCYFHLLRQILRVRLEYLPDNLKYFPEVSISDDSLQELYDRYYSFLLRGFIELSSSPTKEVYVTRKLKGYIQSLADETITRIVDVTIPKICPSLMPFMLGEYLSRLKTSYDSHKSWVEDPGAPRSLLQPRRTSALVRAYCIQQMFGVVTFPKFDPEEAELGDMQELYDELAHPDIEINPMHYMQRAFFRYGLFPYVDICPQQQPAGPKLSR